MASSRQTAEETLSLLEDRIRRVNFVLNGDNEFNVEKQPTSKPGNSASARLRTLDRNLSTLASTSPVIADILALQRKYPEYFGSTASVEPLSTPTLASLVIAHSQLYQPVATRLSQLQDLSIPDPLTAAKLIELRPRIEKARERQLIQAKEFSELRARSARAVEAWYEGGVLGMGEQWAEWEERLRDAEILVRRREAVKRREDGMV